MSVAPVVGLAKGSVPIAQQAAVRRIGRFTQNEGVVLDRSVIAVGLFCPSRHPMRARENSFRISAAPHTYDGTSYSSSIDESARRAIHRMVRGARLALRRACHVSSSSTRIARARATRSPGSAVRPGAEGDDWCTGGAPKREAFWGIPDRWAFAPKRSRSRDAPAWAATPATTRGKRENGSAPGAAAAFKNA
jgi:hypothetical protein